MIPLVTVIVAVYNISHYLREALGSVINQTFRNLEIIIVDDGSTDGSETICDEYANDPRIKVVHQRNMGLGAARNAGIDMMTGKYVAFLDGDDAFLPDTVRCMVEYSEKNDADIVVCGYDEVRTESSLSKSILRKRRGISFNHAMMLCSAEALNLLVAGKINCSAWNKLYRSNLWNDLRFPEGCVYEDTQVILRAIEKSSRVMLIPEKLVLYRRRKGSITSTQTEEHIRDYIKAIQIAEKYAKDNSPEVIKDKNRMLLIENNARALSIKYANLLNNSDDNLTETLLKKEAERRWDSLNGQYTQIRSRIVHFLFLHAVWLIVPLRFVWKILNTIIR